MEVIRKSNAGQGFGVAGFVLGLIALILSFIPCLGMYAMLPGVIALVFSLIALSQAISANAPRGLILAALIISIAGTTIAVWQFVNLRRAAETIEREFPDSIREDIGNEIRDNIRRALRDGIEGIDMQDDDSLEVDSEGMIEQLERLEGIDEPDPVPIPEK